MILGTYQRHYVTHCDSSMIVWSNGDRVSEKKEEREKKKEERRKTPS